MVKEKELTDDEVEFLTQALTKGADYINSDDRREKYIDLLNRPMNVANTVVLLNGIYRDELEGRYNTVYNECIFLQTLILEDMISEDRVKGLIKIMYKSSLLNDDEYKFLSTHKLTVSKRRIKELVDKYTKSLDDAKKAMKKSAENMEQAKKSNKGNLTLKKAPAAKPDKE